MVLLGSVHMPDLLVQGLPPPPWPILPEETQGSQMVALAFSDHVLKELLEAFKAPEPHLRLVDQTSHFRIPQSIYPRYVFQARRLDDPVVSISNLRASKSNSAVIEHRMVVETLYEAFRVLSEPIGIPQYLTGPVLYCY